MRLNIRDIAQDGRGIGPDETGRIFFCPDSLPGEIVEAEVISRNDCRPLSRLKSVPERQTPPCPFFGRCGGCQLQHLQYEAGLQLKHRQVRDKLERITALGKELLDCADQAEAGQALASPETFHYRNNTRFHIRQENGKIVSGFKALGSNQIIDLGDASCLLADPVADTVRRAFVSYCTAGEVPDPLPHALQLRHSRERRALLITLFFSAKPFLKHKNKHFAFWQTWLSELKAVLPAFRIEGLGAVLEKAARPGRAAETTELLLSGRDYLHEKSSGHDFFIQQQAFFQVNTPQAARLARYVFDCSEASPERELWDIYGGTGNLGLNFAEAGLPVRVLELNRDSARFGRLQAEANGVSDRMHFYQGDAAALSAKLLAQGLTPDYILTDPPRAGLSPKLIRDLCAAGARQWIYVSCDPATLARDLKLILAGGFRLCSFKTFDMFPWTTHVETVCLLSKLDLAHHN